MFNFLIKAVLSQRLMVMLGTVALALAGLFAWKSLPIDAFPDVTNTQVMILTKASGLAAIDVEQRISYPLEQVMRGLPKVTQVRSLSRAGLSQVVVIFQDGVDTYWTRQVVFERLAMARDQLPPGAEPELGPLSTGLGEVFQYTLESDRHNAMELRTLQDWLVAPMLKPVSGVNEVNSFGGAVKQYQILLTPEKLAQYKLTVAEVTEAVERGNANAGGGVLVSGWEQVYLRGVGLLKDIPDIEQLVIKATDGTPVRLKDVAEVVIGSETRQGAVTRDGRGEVVAGMIIMLKGENSRDVVTRVKETLVKVQGTLPEGVRINVFYDRTSLIEACIATVMNALMEGSVFVILILFLFIAEMRTALIVVLSLPLTFLVSFIVMGWAGLSSNLMSLGGLAFSVGMVVDASIVVIENIRRQLAARLNDPRRTVIIEAVQEVGRPVAFSVMIIAIILVPLFTLQGIEGKMFAPLALTLLIALMVSLGVAFTTIPVLADLSLKQEPEREFGFIRKFHHGYLALLDKVLHRPGRTLVVATGILLASLGAIPFIGTEFMPALDEGAIAINVVRLPNASLEGSVRVADFMEKQLRRFPEIESVVCKTGRAEISEDPMGPEQTDVFIVLKERKRGSSGRTREKLVEAINRDLSLIPGLRFSFSQPIALRVNELISGIKSDLAVKVFGPDLDLLKDYADRAAGLIRSAPGAQDTKVEQVTGMNQLDVVIDRQAAARHGIRIGDINDTIESAIAGVQATTLIEGEKRFAVVVRFEEKSRRDEEAIKRLWIAAPGGERVPLEQLASFQRIEAPAQISRENGMRRVVVETNVRGRDLGGFVKDIRQKLAPLAGELPPGYFIEYGGQFENQQRAMRQLSIVVPVALILIFILLFAALGSVRHSLLVLANLPFALVGGVLAVAAFGMHLSVSAAVAFIVLLGIAVQNGVVLVAFFRQLNASGLGLTDTVRNGCDIRFRPLLMTALTSFIGHLPMLYATGSGADIQKPLAVVVMGGIITSQLLTLLVLPALYVLMERYVLSRDQKQ
jgi:cobalt-zinc-cadmium resistance protein CzcA